MRDKNQTIAIFGAGYVGLTTSVLLANSSYSVCLVETNQERLKILKGGKSFFYEEGINELLHKALKDGSLTITDDAKVALKGANIVFSCVGTPDNPDGSSNLEYVFSVANTFSEFADNKSIFVQKSTVPVKTGEKIEEIFAKSKKALHYASNPEFLREGTAVQDSLWFDRVVVGSNNKAVAEAVIDVYKQMESHRDSLTLLAKIPPAERQDGSYVITNRNSAELTKVTANAFLALKISFANSIAKLADKADADVNEVMDAVGADRRIGRDFLNAGRGYGGGCFPKDVSGLIASAAEHGVDMPIMAAAADVNSSMAGYIAEKANIRLGGLRGAKVAVLGLAFKAGTSDARRSPGAKLANVLNESGAEVNAYDPHANKEAKGELRQAITITDTVSSAVKNVDAVFVSTEWNEFLGMDLNEIKNYMKGSLFVDAINRFNPELVAEAKLDYIGVGRGAS